MSYLFDIRKLKKIIFGFLIVFSFFQVCSDSFAKDGKKENKNATVVKDKKIPAPLSLQLVNSKIEEANNRITSIEKKPNFSLDNMPLIISTLSLLLNFIFITLYFIGNKTLSSKITKLSSKIKNQNNINVLNTNNFSKNERDSISFSQSIEKLSIEINHINEAINAMKKNEINEKKRDKSLRDEIRKDNNHYQEEEIKKPISHIKNLCKKHAEMPNREFIKNYPTAIKLDITNAEDVVYRNNDPVFQETDQGKYIAIALPELENSNHYLFYAKGTNITSEDIALKTVFIFDKDYEKSQIYSDWKILEPAILNMNNNNWQIFKKGKIEL